MARADHDDGMLSTAQAADLAGVTQRQLRYWLAEGAVRTATSATPGSGGFVRWTVQQAERARRIGELMAVGLDLACATRIIDGLAAQQQVLLTPSLALIAV